MADSPLDEKELNELADVYGMLKRDARNMLFDLLDGVSLWNSTSRILLYFAVVSFGIALVFSWGWTATFQGPPYVAIGLGLIAIFMYGLFIVTLLTGRRYRKKYTRLKNKYSELFDAAKKLS